MSSRGLYCGTHQSVQPLVKHSPHLLSIIKKGGNRFLCLSVLLKFGTAWSQLRHHSFGEITGCLPKYVFKTLSVPRPFRHPALGMEQMLLNNECNLLAFKTLLCCLNRAGGRKARTPQWPLHLVPGVAMMLSVSSLHSINVVLTCIPRFLFKVNNGNFFFWTS